MIYKKFQINNIIVENIKSPTVADSSRSWKIYFKSSSTNKEYSISVSDISPYPNSFHQFSVDDSIFNIPVGVGLLRVVEVDVTTGGEYEYARLVMNVVTSNYITKEYATTNTDIKVYG